LGHARIARLLLSVYRRAIQESRSGAEG